MGLTLRPGLVVQEVATWELCRDLARGWTRERGRDMRPRPGRYARHAHPERATCAGSAHDLHRQCARHSRHLGVMRATAHAMCAQCT